MVNMLIGHAKVCVMRPRNLVGTFVLPRPSLVDIRISPRKCRLPKGHYPYAIPCVVRNHTTAV